LSRAAERRADVRIAGQRMDGRAEDCSFAVACETIRWAVAEGHAEAEPC